MKCLEEDNRSAENHSNNCADFLVIALGKLDVLKEKTNVFRRDVDSLLKKEKELKQEDSLGGLEKLKQEQSDSSEVDDASRVHKQAFEALEKSKGKLREMQKRKVAGDNRKNELADKIYAETTRRDNLMKELETTAKNFEKELKIKSESLKTKIAKNLKLEGKLKKSRVNVRLMNEIKGLQNKIADIQKEIGTYTSKCQAFNSEHVLTQLQLFFLPPQYVPRPS